MRYGWEDTWSEHVGRAGELDEDDMSYDDYFDPPVSFVFDQPGLDTLITDESQSHLWHSSEGVVRIEDMTDEHLVNAITWVESICLIPNMDVINDHDMAEFPSQYERMRAELARRGVST